MAGDQPSDDQEPATQPGAGLDNSDDSDAPQLPVDPIDPAATPLPAGTPPFPPVVPPAPPPATIELPAPAPAPTPATQLAVDSTPAASPAGIPGSPAVAGSAAGPPNAGAPVSGDTQDADAPGDPTSSPGHTIRTLAIAIVALVVLLGVGVLAMQKFGSDPSPQSPADGAVTASTPAATSPTGPAGPAVTVKVILLTSSDSTSQCPGVARLMGTITVAGGPTDVTYRWTHSDGRDSDIRTVRVDGTTQVTQEWEHPGKPTFLGQTQLEVITPEVAKSTPLTISGSCTPATSPRPANGSPSPSR